MSNLQYDPPTGGLFSQILHILTNSAPSLFGRVPETIFVPLDAFNVTHSDCQEALTGLERDLLSSSSDMEGRHIRFFDNRRPPWMTGVSGNP
jgi:hypothetical protein